MKILFKISTLLLLTISSSNTFSQTENISFGVGIEHGSLVEELGLDVRAGYMVTDKINLVVDFNFFLLDDRNGRFIKNRFWNELNVNVQYHYSVSESLFQPYTLFGINITNVGIKYDDHPVFDDERESNSDLGLNVGGGVELNASSVIKPFAEVKYLMVTDYDQGEICVGIKFLLK